MRRVRRYAPLAIAVALPLASQAGHVLGVAGVEHWIDFEFDRPTSASHHVTDRIAFGIEVELELSGEFNFDLDSSDDGDERKFSPSANFYLAYDLSPKLGFFGEMELSGDIFENNPDGKLSQLDLELKQAVFTWLPNDHLAIGLGRMDVSDERQWLFDDELDGLDVVYRTDGFALEAAVWREELLPQHFFREHDDNEPNRLYLRGFWEIGEDARFDAYALASLGRLNHRDEDYVHLGLSTFGEVGSLEYWLEAATVLGREDGRDVRGFGFDVGVVKTFKKQPLRPFVSAGFAFGSGDDGEGDDNAFRQTGIEDNTAKFGGIASYKSYGEVLDPELSNLMIASARAGIHPTPRSSVEIAYHHVRQHRLSDEFRDAALDIDPNGRSRDLGNEINVAIGIREVEGMKIELTGGIFLPGRGFDERDPAYFAEATVRFKF